MLTKPHATIVADVAGRLIAQINGTTTTVNNALTNGIKKTPMNGLDADITAEELKAAFGAENVTKVQGAVVALTGE